MVKIIKAFYEDKGDKSINVDCSPIVRKHFKYGCNFIGYAHGCDEVIRDLPRVFMDEFPQDWSSSPYREIHIGHLHKSKEWNYVGVDSFGSTTVRMIPSLCSTDAWHYSKGFVGRDRAAMSFLWNKSTGLTGSFLTHVQEK